MSKIEWTEQTWNPIVGCSIVSPGCTNCYAMGEAARQIRCARGSGRDTHYAGLVKESKAGPVWTGDVVPAPDRILLAPLHRQKPTMYFVNSMGDLFHEAVPDEWIDHVFAVMALTPQHTYQVLTKRSARMRDYFEGKPDQTRRSIVNNTCFGISQSLGAKFTDEQCRIRKWPLPNVWLGVSTENQRRADERIPDLLATPAAIRFISAEPLLGSIDIRPWLSDDDGCEWCDDGTDGSPNHCSRKNIPREQQCPRLLAVFECTEGPRDADGTPEWVGADRITLDWVIAGGESGPDARPMHPDWARSLRDQCAAADVPFFFKQWGEWAPGECANFSPTRTEDVAYYDCDDTWSFGKLSPRESEETHVDDAPDVYRIGKSRAGRYLDGITHDAMPVTPAEPA